MSSTSLGISLLVNTKGVSIVAPLVSGRYFLLKFRNASISNITHASSPSQSLLVAACSSGCANSPCVCANPIILPIIPALVCGARTIVRWPTSFSGFFIL